MPSVATDPDEGVLIARQLRTACRWQDIEQGMMNRPTHWELVAMSVLEMLRERGREREKGVGKE